MKKEQLSDIAVLVLRIGLGAVFLYFGINTLIHLQASAEVITALGISINPVFLIILYSILKVVIGAFFIIGLFTRITGFVATVMLAVTMILFWGKLQIFVPRDMGIIAAAIFLIINGGGRIGLDSYVRVRKVFEG